MVKPDFAFPKYFFRKPGRLSIAEPLKQPAETAETYSVADLVAGFQRVGADDPPGVGPVHAGGCEQVRGLVKGHFSGLEGKVNLAPDRAPVMSPGEERQLIVERFQDPDNPLRFFVGQPRTGGYGLTLTEAHTVIYYSNGYDLEVRLQSEDRAHRIGQTNKVTYIDIVAEGTVDEKVLRALRDKIDISTRVLAEGHKEWII